MDQCSLKGNKYTYISIYSVYILYDVWRVTSVCMSHTKINERWEPAGVLNSLANNRQTNFICPLASANSFRVPNQIVLVTKGHKGRLMRRKIEKIEMNASAPQHILFVGVAYFCRTVFSPPMTTSTAWLAVPMSQMAKWPALIKKHLIYAHEYALNRTEGPPKTKNRESLDGWDAPAMPHQSGADMGFGGAFQLFAFTFRFTFCRWLFDMLWMDFWLAVWDWNRSCVLKRISNYFETRMEWNGPKGPKRATMLGPLWARTWPECTSNWHVSATGN